MHIKNRVREDGSTAEQGGVGREGWGGRGKGLCWPERSLGPCTQEQRIQDKNGWKGFGQVVVESGWGVVRLWLRVSGGGGGGWGWWGMFEGWLRDGWGMVGVTEGG